MGPGAARHELRGVDENDGEGPGRDGAWGSGEESKVSGAGGYGGGGGDDGLNRRRQ
jgi:hypothetical protein